MPHGKPNKVDVEGTEFRGFGLDSPGSRQFTESGCCEVSNESSVYIFSGEFLNEFANSGLGSR